MVTVRMSIPKKFGGQVVQDKSELIQFNLILNI